MVLQKIVYCLNAIRSFPVWIILRILRVDKTICADMEGYLYCIRGGKNELGKFQLFNRITAKRRLFHNVVQYRVKQVNKIMGFAVGLLLPIKQDLEISCGEISGGLTIFHGHGTVIVCKQAGSNLTVYQGATIGKNSKPGKTEAMPIIGNHVTVYTNAVVAGDIVIGNNVDIGAGAVVLKDVPDNTVVIGNPCIFKQKRMD